MTVHVVEHEGHLDHNLVGVKMIRVIRGRYIPGRSLDYRTELAARSAVLIPVPYLSKGCETMYEHQPRIGKRTQHRDQAHWMALDVYAV